MLLNYFWCCVWPGFRFLTHILCCNCILTIILDLSFCVVGFVLNASPFMLWFSHSWGPNFKLSLGQLEYILKWLKQYMNGRHFELLWMSLLFSPLKIKTYLWVEYLSINFFPCQNSIGIYHCRREEQGQHDFYSIIDIFIFIFGSGYVDR